MKRNIFILNIVILFATILYIVFSFQTVSTLLNGSFKLVSAMEFSKDMEVNDLTVFINKVIGEGSSEVIEYKKGYEIYLEVKDGHTDIKELNAYLDTKNEEYLDTVQILKVSQWIVLTEVVLTVVAGTLYYKERRKLKLENIS